MDRRGHNVNAKATNTVDNREHNANAKATNAVIEQLASEGKVLEHKTSVGHITFSYVNLPNEKACQHILKTLLVDMKIQIDSPLCNLPMHYVTSAILTQMLQVATELISSGPQVPVDDKWNAFVAKYVRVKEATGLNALLHYTLFFWPQLLDAELHAAYLKECVEDVALTKRKHQIVIELSSDEEAPPAKAKWKQLFPKVAASFVRIDAEAKQRDAAWIREGREARKAKKASNTSDS